jgi:hypothetical protein
MSKKGTTPSSPDLSDQGKLEEKLTEYMEEHPPKAARLSKLDPVKNFIFRMYTDGYSHEQIAGFVAIIGINVHSTTVGRYISKHADNCVPSKTKVVSSDTQKFSTMKGTSSASLDALRRPSELNAKYTPYSNESQREGHEK